MALFLDELENLLDHLGIRDNYALLGQSWGGMLASEHAVLQPAGLRALIIANSPADMSTWLLEVNRLRQLLPIEVQQTLLKHERAGTLTSTEYFEAARVSTTVMSAVSRPGLMKSPVPLPRSMPTLPSITP